MLLASIDYMCAVYNNNSALFYINVVCVGRTFPIDLLKLQAYNVMSPGLRSKNEVRINKNFVYSANMVMDYSKAKRDSSRSIILSFNCN